MTHDQPLVSIIVRTKDRPQRLQEALASIRTQTYRPLQAVVVNDGGAPLPRNELREALGDVDLVYVHHEINRGRAQAANSGLDHADGDLVGFLDDDDRFYPEHVETLAGYLRQSDIAVVYSDALMVNENYDPAKGEWIRSESDFRFSRDFHFDQLLFDNYIPLLCLLFRRRALDDTGGFDPGFELYEDHDFLIRLGEHHSFHHIATVTAEYVQWSRVAQIAQQAEEAIRRRAQVRLFAKHLDKFTAERLYRHRHHVSAAKDDLIRKLQEAVQEREARLLGFQQSIHSYQQMVQDRDQEIARLEAQSQKREAQLDKLLQLVDDLARSGNEKEHKFNELLDLFRARNREIEGLRQRVRDLETWGEELIRRGTELATSATDTRQPGLVVTIKNRLGSKLFS